MSLPKKNDSDSDHDSDGDPLNTDLLNTDPLNTDPYPRFTLRRTTATSVSGRSPPS